MPTLTPEAAPIGDDENRGDGMDVVLDLSCDTLFVDLVLLNTRVSANPGVRCQGPRPDIYSSARLYMYIRTVVSLLPLLSTYPILPHSRAEMNILSTAASSDPVVSPFQIDPRTRMEFIPSTGAV